MTTRALLWCGYVRPPRHDNKGRVLENAYDFPASKNDIEVAVRAARALGCRDAHIYPFVCDDGLLPDDFREPAYEATLADLRRVAARISGGQGPDDALLFVASNHGVEEGLLTTAELDALGDDPLHLTPAVLDECLSRLTGPQIVLVATCYSGVFLQLGARSNRAVFTACGADQRYHVEEPLSPRSPFLHKLLGGWCGVCLPDEDPPARVSLDEAFHLATAELAAAGRALPRRSGNVLWP